MTTSATPDGSAAVKRLVDFIVAKASPADIQSFMADGVISKAMSNLAPHDSKQISDMYEVDHTVAATAEEVKVGPEEAASGGGAARMVDHYSKPTPQMGATKAAEDLGNELAKLAGIVKSMRKDFANLTTDFVFMKSILAKYLAKADKMESSEHDESTADKDEDKKAAAKSAEPADLVAKATGFYDTAKTAFAKADRIEARSPSGAEAQREAATVALMKAYKIAKAASLIADDATKADALCKAIVELAKGEGVEDQDTWPDDRDEKPNKADAKASAKSGVDVAAELADVKTKLEKALSGHAHLTGSVNSMFEMLTKAATSSAAPPPNLAAAASTVAEMFKSNPEAAVNAKRDEIAALRDSGQISEQLATQAMDMAGYVGAHFKGLVSMDMVQSRLRHAPPSIQALFPIAA